MAFAIIIYVHIILGTKVWSLPNGLVPANKKLVDIAEKLKPFIRDLIDHANTVSVNPLRRNEFAHVYYWSESIFILRVIRSDFKMLVFR